LAETSIDRATEKRLRILDAARFLILRDGLRSTTMQAIAREAGIAKPTLYAQFPDKDAVFSAIIDALVGDITAATSAGLAGPGTVAERVGAALAGQYGVLLRLLDGSPHAAELMSEHKRAGIQIREQDLQYQSVIAEALQAAGIAAPRAAMLTQLVAHAAYGIAFKATSESDIMAGIKLLCDRLITPELP
jgi:AcrR family transcriptional regulator